MDVTNDSVLTMTATPGWSPGAHEREGGPNENKLN
jgi:hypothetical protein